MKKADWEALVASAGADPRIITAYTSRPRPWCSLGLAGLAGSYVSAACIRHPAPGEEWIFGVDWSHVSLPPSTLNYAATIAGAVKGAIDLLRMAVELRSAEVNEAAALVWRMSHTTALLDQIAELLAPAPEVPAGGERVTWA